MYIYPDNAALQYSGRIDFDCPAEPVFVYAASYVKLIFTGTFVKVKISNRRNYWTNYIFWMVSRESSHWIWSREQKYTRLRKIWKAGGTNCFCSNEWTPATSLPCMVLNWRMGQKYFCRSQSRSGGWKCLATVSPAVRSPRR